jgi:hypothetical protein
MPMQVATVGQLLDAARHGHPLQTGLLGGNAGEHAPTGSTGQYDCIVSVKHLYLSLLFATR